MKPWVSPSHPLVHFKSHQWKPDGGGFNPSTQEAEAGESLSLRPAWSTEQVAEQAGLHREPLVKTQNSTNC